MKKFFLHIHHVSCLSSREFSNCRLKYHSQLNFEHLSLVNRKLKVKYKKSLDFHHNWIVSHFPSFYLPFSFTSLFFSQYIFTRFFTVLHLRQGISTSINFINPYDDSQVLLYLFNTLLLFNLFNFCNETQIFIQQCAPIWMSLQPVWQEISSEVRYEKACLYTHR